MLAFYGLRLVDAETGELALEDSTPAPSPSSYLRRFQNLENHSHNFLRITRILKCLNEVCTSSSYPRSNVSARLLTGTLRDSSVSLNILRRCFCTFSRFKVRRITTFLPPA